jgi:Fe-S oxidoreductase
MGLFSIFGGEELTYFPGCVTYFKNRENFELYKKIFSKLGINFRVISKKICCGLPALEAGYETEARRLARKNFEIFKEERINSVITNCPACYKMLMQNYNEMMPDWDIKVKNIWKIILEKLENKPKIIKFKEIESVGFHDNCYLGRYCNTFDEPRRILELLGYEIKEFQNNKNESFCCGSCGGLIRTNPELVDKIAKERILQAKRIGIKKIIVTSFDNLNLLKKNLNGKDIEILELSEVLAIGLGLKKPEKNKSYEHEEKIDKEEKEVDRILEEAIGEEDTKLNKGVEID